MAEIKLTGDFLNIEGKVMNRSRECCIQKANGELAMINGQLATVLVPTPDDILSLKKVCINALLAELPQEQVDPTEKYDKYKIFQKLHKADKKIELDSKELELVKKWIGKYWETLVMGQAYDMLEGK